MERRTLHHMLALGGATALAVLSIATVQACWAAEDEPAMAPGEPAAPAVEALLPQLLRADYGAPYSMAAIRFGPEFWAALDADSSQQHQPRNMLRNLFEGGLLFGIGPLDNLLTVANRDRSKAAQPAVRWAAPPTMRATLHLQGNQAEIIIDGQRADWVRKVLPSADPGNLLNQLEFVWFPLRGIAAGQAILGDIARSMTLNIVGLAPGATQTFTWAFEPPPAYPEGQPPLVAQRNPGYPRGYTVRLWPPTTQRRPPAPTAPTAPATGFMGGFPEDATTRALQPDAAVVGLPAEGAPEGAVGDRGPLVAPAYPVARAASNVGSEARRGQQALIQAPPAWESYAAVEQITRGEGAVTVAYYSGPDGRRDVEVMSREGNVVDRVTSGPVSADGQGMATWGLPKDATPDGLGNFAFIVRNTVETPQGAQVTEAAVPVSATESRDEPAGAMAPPPAAVADLTIVDMSVANEFLQIRAAVGVLADRQPVVIPPLHVTIADEAGKLVREIRPEQPTHSADYVFAWDSTGADGNRLPEGRYLLRIATETRSDHGFARSELRYWIELPLEKTQRRFEILGPAMYASLQPRVDEVTEGGARFTYALPEQGKARIFVTDVDGRVVRRLLEDQLDEGPHVVTWDGADDQGQPVPEGTYTVQFELDAGDRGAWGALAVECPLPTALTPH